MSIATIFPTSFDTPEEEIGDPVEAVSSPSNTGHGSTTASSSGTAQLKTISWDGFQASGVTPTLVKLKVDWTEDGNLGGSSPPNVNTLFEIDYSLDGGVANLIVLRSAQEVIGAGSGSSEATLSNGQDLTLVRVFNALDASAAPGHNCSITASISNVRIEITFDAPPQTLLSSMM